MIGKIARAFAWMCGSVRLNLVTAAFTHTAGINNSDSQLGKNLSGTIIDIMQPVWLFRGSARDGIPTNCASANNNILLGTCVLRASETIRQHKLQSASSFGFLSFVFKHTADWCFATCCIVVQLLLKRRACTATLNSDALRMTTRYVHALGSRT